MEIFFIRFVHEGEPYDVRINPFRIHGLIGNPLFLSTLRKLKERLASGATPLYGICGTVGIDLRTRVDKAELEGFLAHLRGSVWMKWRPHSGERLHPIPGGKQAYNSGARWEGNQRKYRIDLINFTIAYLEAYHD